MRNEKLVNREIGRREQKDYEKVIWKAKEFESMATFYKERTADFLKKMLV